MTKEEKKRFVINRICRVLGSKKEVDGECVIGREAQVIVNRWFETTNSFFGGKSPEECLDMDFDRLVEYIDFLERGFLHEKVEADAFNETFDESVRHAPGLPT
jgi:hypothetical protein